MSQVWDSSQVQQELPGWRVVQGKVRATFDTGSFTVGVDFINRLTELAEAADHHPDVDLRYPRVHISMFSHDVGALTQRDVNLARQITNLAAEMDITVDTASVQTVEVAIDAIDFAAVRPFWEAVLGYRSIGDDEIGDPHGLGPVVWFQPMDQPRPQRNRIHLDVCVPHDVARARVEAALDAGGHLVSDSQAPAFWVLADSEGNEACVCTSTGTQNS